MTQEEIGKAFREHCWDFFDRHELSFLEIVGFLEIVKHEALNGESVRRERRQTWQGDPQDFAHLVPSGQ